MSLICVVLRAAGPLVVRHALPRLAGVVVAGLAIMARRSPVIVLLAAAAATAAVRAL